MEREPGSVEEKWCIGPGPFLFSGKPPLVTGTIHIINKSTEKVKVRNMAMESPDLASILPQRLQQAEGQDMRALTEQWVPQIKMFGRLGPFDQTSVPAQISIHKFTPPGEYKAQVRCGDQQEEVLIFVLEDFDLRVIPEQLNITAAGGETVKAQAYIANQGNVTFSTRRAVFAPLLALNMVHRAFAAALDEAGHAGHEKFLDQFVSEMSDSEVQPAKVRVDIDEQEIRPGESKRVDIQIHLPANLKKNKIYRGRIDFKNARLAMEIDVRSAPAARTRRPQ